MLQYIKREPVSPKRVKTGTMTFNKSSHTPAPHSSHLVIHDSSEFTPLPESSHTGRRGMDATVENKPAMDQKTLSSTTLPAATVSELPSLIDQQRELTEDEAMRAEDLPVNQDRCASSSLTPPPEQLSDISLPQQSGSGAKGRKSPVRRVTRSVSSKRRHA
jgi:hypothetical protein